MKENYVQETVEGKLSPAEIFLTKPRNKNPPKIEWGDPEDLSDTIKGSGFMDSNHIVYIGTVDFLKNSAPKKAEQACTAKFSVAYLKNLMNLLWNNQSEVVEFSLTPDGPLQFKFEVKQKDKMVPTYIFIAPRVDDD